MTSYGKQVPLGVYIVGVAYASVGLLLVSTIHCLLFCCLIPAALQSILGYLAEVVTGMFHTGLTSQPRNLPPVQVPASPVGYDRKRGRSSQRKPLESAGKKIQKSFKPSPPSSSSNLSRPPLAQGGAQDDATSTASLQPRRPVPKRSLTFAPEPVIQRRERHDGYSSDGKSQSSARARREIKQTSSEQCLRFARRQQTIAVMQTGCPAPTADQQTGTVARRPPVRRSKSLPKISKTKPDEGEVMRSGPEA